MTLSARLREAGYAPDMTPLADEVVDVRDEADELERLHADLAAAYAVIRRHADGRCMEFVAVTPEELAVFRKAQEAHDGR